MCIAGFYLENFNAAWPAYYVRAMRWVDADAIQEARERHNSGDGVCLVGEDGLMVLSLETDDNGTRLFVLLGVSTGRIGAVERQEKALDLIAAQVGATSIAFRTNRRRGFRRMLGPRWRRDGDEFSRSV